MKEPVNLLLFRLGVAVLFVSVIAFQAAALEVSDTLSGGTWTTGDSPVKVVGDLLLPDETQLTIEPGVRVEFTGPYQFIIEGVLIAEGNRHNRIVFTAEHPDVDNLRWKGMRFVNGDRGCKLIFCDITYGWARYEDPWPENCGGGIYLEGSSPEIRSCYIAHNWAARDGGGIYAMFTTSLMKNNLIVDNISGKNVIGDELLNGYGGGLFISYSEPTIMNCTVAHNTAGAKTPQGALIGGGGIFIGAEGMPRIVNSIISHNNQNFARVTEESVSFSDILGPYHPNEPNEGPLPGPGNLIVDPVFVNVTDPPYNYHLRLDSPCIDAGDPEMNPAEEPDVLVNRINMGAYGGTVEAALSVPVIYNYLDSLGISIRFDSIRTGSLASKEITIENRGHYRLFIQDFDFTSDAFSPDMVEVGGLMVPEYSVEPIEPGENAKYAINFIPTELKTYNDTLTIYSTASHQPPLKLTLIGTGIDPLAVLEDSLLNFGNRQIDLSHTGVVRITNAGSSALRFSSLRIQGDGFDAEISDEHEILEPDETGDVTITFTPTRPENYEASISLRTNDRDLLIVAKGKGVGPKMVIVGPEIVVEKDTLFMGYVYAGDDTTTGDTAIYTIKIANQGDSLLRVTEANITGTAFSMEIPNGGLTVSAEDTAELPINFHPSHQNRVYFSELVIKSNYPHDKTVVLNGCGMAEPGKYVFGDVGGETWEKLGEYQSYIVLDTIYIPMHTKLRIRPGANILFISDVVMYVYGELRAVGRPDEPITFSPRDTSGSDEARWGGIYLNYDDGTRMSYCVLRGSRVGLRILEASPLIEYCTIADNHETGASLDTSRGGGIYLENSGAKIAGCLIEGNIAGSGGGIYVKNSKPVINNCTIRNNQAALGGGVFLHFLSSALMQSNLIYGNDNCAVIVTEYSSPRIINNTIADNTGGGIYASVRSIPVLINSILWNNHEDTGEELQLDRSSNVLVSYSDIAGGYFGTENLDVEPGFAGGTEEPYLLNENSPLKDKGNPEPIYRDHFFPPSLGCEICDIGAYGGPLGGCWTIPDLRITLFQNPAFPHWIDIFVTSLDTIRDVSCSLELGAAAAVPVPLSSNPSDDFTFMGSYEAFCSGTMFITVEAVLIEGRSEKSLKVSRTYELVLLEKSGGRIQTVGVKGYIDLPQGSYKGTPAVLAGYEPEPIQPADGKLFLSPLFFIMGLDDPLLTDRNVYPTPTDRNVYPTAPEFVCLTVEFNGEGWNNEDLSRLGIYRLESGDWLRLEGGYNDGVITGKIDRGGCFALAWDAQSSPYSAPLIPQATDLIRAYPNPFNEKVSIEFNLERKTDIQLAVYDLGGRRIVDLIDQTLPAGNHIAVWNGCTENGVSLPSGIYWARLEGVKDSCLVKLLLLR